MPSDHREKVHAKSNENDGLYSRSGNDERFCALVCCVYKKIMQSMPKHDRQNAACNDQNFCTDDSKEKRKKDLQNRFGYPRAACNIDKVGKPKYYGKYDNCKLHTLEFQYVENEASEIQLFGKADA